MNAESPGASIVSEKRLGAHRRWFRIHVGAVALTAAVVVPLLLGIASIPVWVSVACCFTIATVALAFVAAAVKDIRGDVERSVSERVEYLFVTLGLSLAQAIFILPVLVCVFMPTLRL